MFIGRKDELSLLDEFNNSDKFQFLVMYGRRRVGKTSILQEFSRRHRTILFSAQEKNDAFRNTKFDMKEYEDLMCASSIFTQPENRYYYIFSKGGFNDEVCRQAERDGVKRIEIADLFHI